MCVAGGGYGNTSRVRSYSASGAGWHWVPGKPGAEGLLFSISCPSAKVCYGASGTEIFSSANSGHSWRLAATFPAELFSMRCPGPKTCMAAGGGSYPDVYRTTDGWKKSVELKMPRHMLQWLGSLACLPGGRCYAAPFPQVPLTRRGNGHFGVLMVGSRATNKPWRLQWYRRGLPALIESLACHAPSTCVAVGYRYSWPDPWVILRLKRNLRTWAVVRLGRTTGPLYSVACALFA